MAWTYPGPVSSRRSERGRPPKGDRRERALLDAAERLLTTGDFDSSSVADLAEAAGISRATFYFYFASKQALLSAAVADAVSGLEGRLDAQRADDAGTPAERVAATVHAAAELWRQHRVVLMASVELGATMPDVYQRGMESIARVTELSVALLTAAGHPEAVGDPGATARVVAALVLMSERNFYDLARTSSRPADYDALVAVLTTIWLRALGLDAPG